MFEKKIVKFFFFVKKKIVRTHGRTHNRMPARTCVVTQALICRKLDLSSSIGSWTRILGMFEIVTWKMSMSEMPLKLLNVQMTEMQYYNFQISASKNNRYLILCFWNVLR